MLNYSGLMYRATHIGVVSIALGLFSLTIYLYLDYSKSRKNGKKKRQQRRHKKDMICVLICMLIGILYSASYFYKVYNPQVAEFVGTFCYDYRDSGAAPPFPYTLAYIFLPEVNDGFHKDEFYLDVATEKEIIPEGFEEDQLYRIYYEESCKVILGVDVLSSDKE